MSEAEPKEQLPTIVVGDLSRGAPAPGGARFGFFAQRDPIDGALEPDGVASGYGEPLQWELVDHGTGLDGVRDRRMALRLVDDGDGRRSTRIINAAGVAAPITSLVRVVRADQAPAVAIRVSGAQIDPGLAVSILLRQGWRPRGLASRVR